MTPFVVLALATLAVNAASATYGVGRARSARARPAAARADGMLLVARSLALLAVVAVAIALHAEPRWLVGVASATAIVQALDLVAGISLRLRDAIRAALLGLVTEGAALVAFGLLGGASD